MNYLFYSTEGYSKALHHVLLDPKLRVNHIITCEIVYNWKGNRFSSFGSKLIRAWCKSGSRTPGPGTCEPPQSLKVGPETSLKFKSGTPGPSSKFKSWTSGPALKFKSGTHSSFLNELIFFKNISEISFLFDFLFFFK